VATNAVTSGKSSKQLMFMNIQIHHFLMQPVTPCNVPSVVMLCTESFLNGLPDNSIL